MAKNDKKAESAGSQAFARVPGSVTEIADRLGCNASQVSRYRSGERKPGKAMKLKIFDAYGIDPELWRKAPHEVPRDYSPRPPVVVREAAKSGPASHLAEIDADLEDVEAILNSEPCLTCGAPNLNNSERIKVIDTRTRLRALKGKALKDAELLEDRLVREHPAFRRLVAAIIEPLKDHPEALGAVVAALSDEGMEVAA